MLMMLVLSGLQACMVGIIKVEAPQVPLTKNPVDIGRDVSFEVCVPPEVKKLGKASEAFFQKEKSKKIEALFQEEFGIYAHPEAPATDKPYFHFLIFPQIHDYHYIFSGVISVLTLGVIPGYLVEQAKIDIQSAAKDANGRIIKENYAYEYRVRYFLWLPLIFYPDFVLSINGGYVNKDKDDLGLKLVLKSFIVDATEKLNQQSIDEKPVDSSPILKCPDQQ
jgi:hypothetical protein